ncbi:MAG: hypothetical protein QF588_07265, partial [Candidatus Poseidoniaceae archaeon]|nr:hypothetical protein [Candidatus Poseidoniaceae archaeon]
MNDYLDVTSFEFGGDFTIEMYIKLYTITTATHIFQTADYDAVSYPQYPYWDDLIIFAVGSSNSAKGRGYWESQGSAPAVETGSNFFEANVWVHMIYTVSGTTHKIYKNGELVATGTAAHNKSVKVQTRDFTMFGGGVFNSDGTIDYNAQGGMIHGTISYARFWNGTALSVGDIQTLFENRETKNPSIFGTNPTITTIADTYDSSIVATPYNGVIFSTQGAEFDGVDDYVDLTPWEFGGAITIEVYVKYNEWSYFERVIEFGDGESDDSVVICNNYNNGGLLWHIFAGSSLNGLNSSSSSIFVENEFVHIVVTAIGSTMRIYKNGILTDTKTDGHTPVNQTRVFHWLGRSGWSNTPYFNGTIAYVRFWHGTALSEYDIGLLYYNRKTINPNIFATTTVIADECDSSISASLMNGAKLSTFGVELDGVDDYVDLTPWEFGGPTTVEAYVKYNSLDYTTIINMENNISATSPIYSNTSIILYNANNTQEAVTYSTGAFSALTGDNTQEFRFYINKWGSPLYFGGGAWRGDGEDDFEKDGALRLYSGAAILWAANAAGSNTLLNTYGQTSYITYSGHAHQVPFRIHLVDGNDGDLISAGDTVYFLHQDGYNDFGEDFGIKSDSSSFSRNASPETRSTYIIGITNPLISESLMSYNNSISTELHTIGPSQSILNDNSYIIESDKWTHFVITIEGTTIKLYKNGVPQETRTDGVEPITMVRDHHRIGGRGSSGDVGNVNCTIAYVRFWNGTIMNAAEIRKLYSMRNKKNIRFSNVSNYVISPEIVPETNLLQNKGSLSTLNFVNITGESTDVFFNKVVVFRHESNLKYFPERYWHD